GCIVHTVSRHGDDTPFFTQTTHYVVLMLRQHLRFELCDMELPRNGCSRCAVITRDHHDANTLALETLERRKCARLDGVGDCNDGCRASIDRDEHRGRAIAAQGFSVRLECGNRDVERPQQRCVPDCGRASTHRSSNTL